jgi:uncharacterized oxidoreductase
MSLLSSEQKSTILITGGASGIGLALAKQFVTMGHTVIVAGRRQQQLDIAKLEVPALHSIQGDVSNDAERIALYQKVVKKFPEINVLFNNAGCLDPATPFKNLTSSDWDQHKNVIAVNLEGPIHLSTLFLKHFLAHGKPSLIANVSSMSVFIPFASSATYAASKGSLNCL